MTETTTTAERLLIVAVQDLFDAEQAWLERLPPFSAEAGPSLAPFLAEEPKRSRRQAERLEGIARRHGEPPSAAPNIWLRAIIDDAARDADTIAAGPLRDIALVGAFRKGKQAERVSYETAIGLAARLGDEQAASELTRSRDEEAETDAALALTLGGLLQQIS